MCWPPIAACSTWSLKQTQVVPGAKSTRACGLDDWKAAIGLGAVVQLQHQVVVLGATALGDAGRVHQPGRARQRRPIDAQVAPRVRLEGLADAPAPRRAVGLTLLNTRKRRVPCIGFDGKASTCSRVSSWRQLRMRPATSVGRNDVLPRRRWPR